MIEPTNGTGLTGITGKSARKGNSSLFSKLLAMLEKQTEASAKGKGLQINTAHLSKSKTTTLFSDKGEVLIAAKDRSGTILSDKGEALIAGKSKSGSIIPDKGEALIAGKEKSGTIISDKGEVLLAGKSKAGSNTSAEETATPLIAANIIIDPATQQSNKGSNRAAVHILIGEQKTEQQGSKGQLANPLLKQAQAAGNSMINGAAAATVEGDEVIQTSSKPLVTEAKTLTSTKNMASNAASESRGPASAGEPETPLNSADKTVQTKQASQAAPEMSTLKTGPANQATATAPMTSATGEQKIAPPLVGEGAKATAQTNQQQGAKADLQAKPETANVLAGAQQQQAKPVQPQQPQNTVVTGATATAVPANSTDTTSLADSGSGSSDRGGQEPRNLSALSGDTKSSGSTSATTNFQSYMTGKATPTMSVFDSMKHIAQSASNGQTKLEIQLDPANLGKIHITLQTDAAKQLQVHMVVDQGATRSSIEQQLPILRSALAQQGFDLSGFSMDSNGQQGTSAENGGRSAGNTAGNNDNLSANSTTTISGQANGRSADGSLSIRV